jgi:hypothetical protein
MNRAGDYFYNSEWFRLTNPKRPFDDLSAPGLAYGLASIDRSGESVSLRAVFQRRVASVAVGFLCGGYAAGSKTTKANAKRALHFLVPLHPDELKFQS